MRPQRKVSLVEDKLSRASEASSESAEKVSCCSFGAMKAHHLTSLFFV
jgi:hypothetical protein